MSTVQNASASEKIYFADQSAYDQWQKQQQEQRLSCSETAFAISKNYGALITGNKQLLEWDRFGHQHHKKGEYIQCSLSDRHIVRVRADAGVEADASGGDLNGETQVQSCKNASFVLASDGVTYIVDQAGKVSAYGLPAHGSCYQNWAEIKTLAECGDILAGLHKNGTVDVAPSSGKLAEAVAKLHDIVQIVCTEREVVALDTSGVAIKCSDSGMTDPISTGETVLQVAASDKTIYALLSDGTVFTTDQGGKTMPWNNIICIAACRGLFAAVDRKGILHTDTSFFCGKAWNEMKLQIPE